MQSKVIWFIRSWKFPLNNLNRTQAVSVSYFKLCIALGKKGTKLSGSEMIHELSQLMIQSRNAHRS